MAETKDKIVTVESLSALHDYNKSVYTTEDNVTEIVENYIKDYESPYVILKSSTEGSEKRFKVTVDDSGVLTATEITENAEI